MVAKRPGWSGIPAVQNHEIIGLNDDIASRWGPRLPQLVAEIAAASRASCIREEKLGALGIAAIFLIAAMLVARSSARPT